MLIKDEWLISAGKGYLEIKQGPETNTGFSYMEDLGVFIKNGFVSNQYEARFKSKSHAPFRFPLPCQRVHVNLLFTDYKTGDQRDLINCLKLGSANYVAKSSSV